MAKDPHYSKLISQLNQGKDSIFEFAKIIQYNADRLVARIYTTTSREYIDDVPILFPAMNKNTGIISPPAKGSTRLVLWGADHQPFLLPAEYTLPLMELKEQKRVMNASPGVRDELLTLRNIQGGEHLIRSLSGSYFYVKNNGDAEMGTDQLHKLYISSQDGSLNTVTERVKAYVGGNQYYFGPITVNSNEDTRTHLYFKMYEDSDETQFLTDNTDDEMIAAILNNEEGIIAMNDIPALYTKQAGHVLDEQGNPIIDSVDGSELFSEEIIQKEQTIIKKRISKKGRIVSEIVTGTNKTEIVATASSVEISQTTGAEKRMKIKMENGKIMISDNNQDYDLLPMLKWFYEQRS